MRSRFLVFALLFGFAPCLVAAVASAAPSTLAAPVTVVYPFTVSGNADPEAGGRIAILFATELAQSGGITVKPATPGTDRTHYLQAAQALGADYYVTGYLTPLGDEVSLVDQIVSTYSGIVVWSNTTQIKTYAEASGQADLIRAAIIRHAGRTLAALDEPAAVPSSTPPPPSSPKNSGNLSTLFSRKPKATPAPAAAPAASAAPSSGAAPLSAAPGPGAASATHPPAPPPPPRPSAAPQSLATLPQAGKAIVVAVGGDADGSARSYASGALAAAIAKAGLGGALVASSTTGDLPTHAKDLCAAHSAAAIYGGTLSLQRQSGAFSQSASANFELVRYDCAGTITGRQRVAAQATGRSDTTVAIDRAIAKSLDATLHPPKTNGT